KSRSVSGAKVPTDALYWTSAEVWAMIIAGRKPYWLVQSHQMAAKIDAGAARDKSSRRSIRFALQERRRYAATNPQTSYRRVEPTRNARAAIMMGFL